MDQGDRPVSKKRTVYAPQAKPQSECSPKPPAVISVELDEDEDVEWTWTHTSCGKSIVTGYTIIKKRTGKPDKQARERASRHETENRHRSGR